MQQRYWALPACKLLRFLGSPTGMRSSWHCLWQINQSEPLTSVMDKVDFAEFEAQLDALYMHTVWTLYTFSYAAHATQSVQWFCDLHCTHLQRHARLDSET